MKVNGLLPDVTLKKIALRNEKLEIVKYIKHNSKVVLVKKEKNYSLIRYWLRFYYIHNAFLDKYKIEYIDHLGNFKKEMEIL